MHQYSSALIFEKKKLDFLPSSFTSSYAAQGDMGNSRQKCMDFGEVGKKETFLCKKVKNRAIQQYQGIPNPLIKYK
jgi:hypothetical protein